MKKKDNKTAEKAAVAESKPAAVALLLKGVEGGTKKEEKTRIKKNQQGSQTVNTNYFEYF